MTALHIYKTEHELLKAIAGYFIEIAKRSIEVRKEFNVALSGGKSPKQLYELLSSSEYKTKIDWTKVYFFFGDERYVPADNSQRNSNMIQQTLFDLLDISNTNIFNMDTTLLPDVTANDYYENISAHFKKLPIRFDLILLGLGGNAHTASLFPFTEVLSEQSATVKSVFIQEQNSCRITFTAPLINQARHIAFLVYGKEKATAVHQVLENPIDFEKYPAQLIRPIEGDLNWFLDEEAASLLNK